MKIQMMLHWIHFLLRQSSYKILGRRTFRPFHYICWIVRHRDRKRCLLSSEIWHALGGKEKNKYRKSFFSKNSREYIQIHTHTHKYIHRYLFPNAIHHLPIPNRLSYISIYCPSDSFLTTASQIPFIHLTLRLHRFLFSGGIDVI
jgi:hypothetical protein